MQKGSLGKIFVMAVIALAPLLLFKPSLGQNSNKNASTGCRISYNANDQIDSAIRQRGFDFKDYDNMCNWLRSNNLKVQFSGEHGVLRERAFSWVDTKIYAADTFVESTQSYNTTYISDIAGTPTAQRLQVQAVNDTLQSIYVARDVHLRALRTEEERLRGVFSKQPSAKK